MQVGWMTYELYLELCQLNKMMDFRKINFEDASSSELALDRVGFKTSMSSVFSILVLLSENSLMINEHKLCCVRRKRSLIYHVKWNTGSCGGVCVRWSSENLSDLPVLNSAACHEDVKVSEAICARDSFGTRWRYVVSFMSRSLYSRGNSVCMQWVWCWADWRTLHSVNIQWCTCSCVQFNIIIYVIVSFHLVTKI
jgi:hypothetical protein